MRETSFSAAPRRRVAASVTAGRSVSYATGLLLLLLALASPLDYLADHVSFSAHMLQHLLLLLVVPPLLLLGLPSGLLVALGDGLRRVVGGSWVARPLPALVLATVVVWIWHVPVLYEAALGNEAIHAGEHLCFLATAFLYWWPLARPETHPWPMPDLVQLGYLLAAVVASSLLGAVLTFAPDVIYPTYAHATPTLGLAPLDDQQAGGLLMWVGGGLWDLAAAGVVFARWFARPVEDGPRRDEANSERAADVTEPAGLGAILGARASCPRESRGSARAGGPRPQKNCRTGCEFVMTTESCREPRR